MELLTPIAILLFSIFGLMLCLALKAACKEASAVGQHLIAESKQAREQFDQAVREAQRAMKPPEQIIITEKFEPASSGRQLLVTA